MKCLIIAAGRGSRLSSKGNSKPLIPLLGLPLIERCILTARKGGMNDFYVVTGYEGEKVRHYLDVLGSKTNISITHINSDCLNSYRMISYKMFLSIWHLLPY